MLTTFSDGTKLAALRWAGPFVPHEPTAAQYGAPGEAALARRGDEVLLLTQAGLQTLGSPFGVWPPAPGSIEPRVARIVSGYSPKVAVLANGDVLCGTVARWHSDQRSLPEWKDTWGFEVTADEGLYTVIQSGKAYVVRYHAACSPDAASRELGRVPAPKTNVLHTALLADGSLLIAVTPYDRPGPIGLYRARSRSRGIEALQPSPGARAARTGAPPRSDVVSVGGVNHLVASARGAWFVTCDDGRPKGNPTHVYELVGDGLELARPPLVVQVPERQLPKAVCRIGDQLAIAMHAAAYAVVITDGIVAHRTDGGIGRPGWNLGAMLASPAGDALLVFAHRAGIARCELLREGDRRLAEPAYDEPAPAEPPEVDEEPKPQTPDRDAWIERVRLHHVIVTISALHYGEAPAEFDGDATSGRFCLFDGSGNHHTVAWCEAGVVASGFDHDYMSASDPDDVRTRRAELLDMLPNDLLAFGKKLFKWRPPSCDVAWFSVASATGGHKNVSGQLAPYLAAEDEMLAEWKEHHSLSQPQIDLACALTRSSRSARRALTSDEAEVLLAHPEGGDVRPAPAQVAIARRLLRAVGIDWASSERR